MKRILFYSNKFSNHLKNRQWEDQIIIDHFDIETQKILSILNYSFKTNPILIKDFKSYCAVSADEVLNLDCPLQKQSAETVVPLFPAILYNCFE